MVKVNYHYNVAVHFGTSCYMIAEDELDTRSVDTELASDLVHLHDKKFKDAIEKSSMLCKLLKDIFNEDIANYLPQLKHLP